MNQYIITYIGGDEPSNPEEGKKHFAKYEEWLGSLGDAALKPMVPPGVSGGCCLAISIIAWSKSSLDVTT